MDTRLALMCGIDIPIPECQLVIHQPTIEEISYIGEEDFFAGVQCLCINKTLLSQDKSGLENTTNFQIFMMIISEPKAADKKFAVQQICTLFFPKYKVIFTPQSLLFMLGNESIMIDENNFDFLQQAIAKIACLNTGRMDQQNFNPVDKKAQEIAQKLMRGRQRIAAEKGGQAQSIFSTYLSVITIGIPSMSLLDAKKLTVYQLYDLIERYGLYVSWDLDVQCRLAGGSPNSEPDNWMKSIH